MHISNKTSIAIHCLIFINEYGEGKNINPVLNQAYDKVKQDMIQSMKKITLDTVVDDFHDRV